MTRKNICLLIACILFAGIPCVTKAAPQNQTKEIKSTGNIFYESSTGSVRLYAEDIMLLKEKLASIPEEIFDPIYYK